MCSGAKLVIGVNSRIINKHLYSVWVVLRAVELEPKQFCMVGVGAKNFWTVELGPESEIWVPVPQ